MIFAKKQELEAIADQIGMIAVSQISSIRCLSKMGLPLTGVVALKKLVDEIDAMLWSLLPMAIEHEKHGKQFVEQCGAIKESVDAFIRAVKEMEKLCKEFQ